MEASTTWFQERMHRLNWDRQSLLGSSGLHSVQTNDHQFLTVCGTSWRISSQLNTPHTACSPFLFWQRTHADDALLQVCSPLGGSTHATTLGRE